MSCRGCICTSPNPPKLHLIHDLSGIAIKPLFSCAKQSINQKRAATCRSRAHSHQAYGNVASRTRGVSKRGPIIWRTGMSAPVQCIAGRNFPTTKVSRRNTNTDCTLFVAGDDELMVGDVGICLRGGGYHIVLASWLQHSGLAFFSTTSYIRSPLRYESQLHLSNTKRHTAQRHPHDPPLLRTAPLIWTRQAFAQNVKLRRNSTETTIVGHG
jgi:hypothetical protein